MIVLQWPLSHHITHHLPFPFLPFLISLIRHIRYEPIGKGAVRIEVGQAATRYQVPEQHKPGGSALSHTAALSQSQHRTSQDHRGRVCRTLPPRQARSPFTARLAASRWASVCLHGYFGQLRGAVEHHRSVWPPQIHELSVPWRLRRKIRAVHRVPGCSLRIPPLHAQQLLPTSRLPRNFGYSESLPSS